MQGPSGRGGGHAAVAVAACLLAAGGAASADGPPYDPAIDIQLFEYSVGPKSFFTVRDADVAGKHHASADLVVTFLTDPFAIYRVDGVTGELVDTRTRVVESVFAGQIGGAVGVSNRFQIGAAMPLIFALSGEGLNPADAMPGAAGLRASGTGDLRLEGKSPLLAKQRLRIAGIGVLSLPTSYGSGTNDFLGDDFPAVRAGLATQWTNAAANLSLGANAAVLLRKPRVIYSSTVGHQLLYGMAATYRVIESVAAIGELFGRADLASQNLEASPLEVVGGVRVQASESFQLVVGGGRGLLRGIGSPGLRMLVSVGWAPDHRDSDGDGISNRSDQCPLLAEDADGFEDDDGCPDPDNDGDQRDDDVDECPLEKEDRDGFEDYDGCPDPDNDGDGILDQDDRCPEQAEDGVKPLDRDGCPVHEMDSDGDGVFDHEDRCPEAEEDFDEFEDWDGCPDPDNDGDRVPDAADRCPLCAEDIDHFEDDDGCPEIDNDRDGIADERDRCPDRAEVINGIDDLDGCPDRGGREVVRREGDRLILDLEPAFDRAGRLDRRGRLVADQIALVMLRSPQVTRWLVVVAADPSRSEARTRRKSQRQADALADHLAKRGVRRETLQVVGAVADAAKVAIQVRESHSATRGEVCPERFVVKPREQPAPTPAGAPASPAVPANAAPPSRTEAQTEVHTIPPPLAALSGVAPSVEFRRNKAVLARGADTLKTLAALLKANPHVVVEIRAHTDSRKGATQSRAISQAQADAVAEFLRDRGVDPGQVKAIGYGMDKPVANNDSSRGRAKNRRIEFSFSVTPQP